MIEYVSWHHVKGGVFATCACNMIRPLGLHCRIHVGMLTSCLQDVRSVHDLVRLPVNDAR